MQFLGNIQPQAFFAKYWEKKHLLIKSAVAIKEDYLDIETLLDMAQDEYFESRVVYQNKNDWNVESGPIKLEGLEDKSKAWTLLIHNLNLYHQESFELEKIVSFIPKWLFDDVMCTYSTDGSTVGAHIDNYNVFILQISGKRIWDIEEDPVHEYRDDCNIKVLKEFKPDFSYELEPGDMIFIPPGSAHRGTSIGESVSLSIGFKSLEDKKILESYIFEVLTNFQDNKFYKTTAGDFATESHILKEEVVDKLQKRMLDHLKNKEFFRDSLTAYLTTPGVSSPIQNDEMSFADFQTAICQNGYEFFEDIQYLVTKDQIVINQESHKLDKATLELILKELSSRGETHKTNIKDEKKNELLFKLYNKNLLVVCDSTDCK